MVNYSYYPGWARWKAKDQNGEVWLYEKKPFLSWPGKCWNSTIGQKEKLYEVMVEDWQNSLQELPARFFEDY